MPVNKRFTDREVDVLKLLAKGWSNKQIGDTLYITQETVKAHVRSIREKTGIGPRVELGMYAIELGLMEESGYFYVPPEVVKVIAAHMEVKKRRDGW